MLEEDLAETESPDVTRSVPESVESLEETQSGPDEQARQNMPRLSESPADMPEQNEKSCSGGEKVVDEVRLHG